MISNPHDNGLDLSRIVPERAPQILQHDDDRDGEIERVTVDYDGDDRDDLVICADTCTGILDFGGPPQPTFHPVTEGYDAGQNGLPPLNLTTYATMAECGTKAHLSVWPRAAARSVAMFGLFRVWDKARAVQALIRQAHGIFISYRPYRTAERTVR